MRRLTLLAFLLAACAAPTGELAPELQTQQPIAAAAARITVRGLGCPQCASNIDLQLKQVRGVAAVRVDLGQGLVDVDFVPGLHPSVRDLANAVRDSGFTVVAVEGK
jgi:copper chaperone CopZ